MSRDEEAYNDDDDDDEEAIDALRARFPQTDTNALRLVLRECQGDVARSAALIQQLVDAKRGVVFRVLFAWQPRSTRELAVVRGDVVTAHNSDPHALPWLAVAGDSGVSGGVGVRFVPMACLRPLRDDIGAVALRDYVCGEDKVGHLPFRRDDRLVLLSRIPHYDWWYARHCATAAVGRVPITLLRVESNADVFALEAQRVALPIMPTVDPPLVCGSVDDVMDDALSDTNGDDASDDPLFYNVTFVEAEQQRRQTLLDAGDARVDEAQRELIAWAAALRRQSRDDSSSSSSTLFDDHDSLWLNATQSALVRSGLARRVE